MAKKTSAKRKGQKRTPSTRKPGAGARAVKAGQGRKTAGAKTPAGKARKKTAPRSAKPAATKKAAKRPATKAARPAAAKKALKKTAARRASTRPPASAKRTSAATARKTSNARKGRGGSGRESELAQTPETGRSVQGPTNPFKTKRSTGTPAGAGDSRPSPDLDRERRRLRDVEETVEGPPSSLDLDRTPSAARSGRRRLQGQIDETNETGPALTGGDVDADWSDAYAVGDEAPGGDNPTPDQDIVDDIGRALGVEYQDNEELKGADKIAERDRHRWELDPASSDDYLDRE